MKKHLSYLIVFCLSISQQALAQSYPMCIQNRFAESAYFSSAVVVSDYEIEYGFAPNWQFGNDTLSFDIHYPNPTIDPLDKRPLVVLAHSGQFKNGNKSTFTNYCKMLAERGFVAVTTSYRQGWQDNDSVPCSANVTTLYEAMYRAVQDLNACIRYVVDKKDFYKIDTNYIFVGGASSGAITALNAAFLEDSEVASVFPAVVTNMGGLDVGTNPIFAPFTIKGVINWCGAVLDTAIVDVAESIPVLSMHSEQDNIVPIDSGNLFGCGNPQLYPTFYGSRSIYYRLNNLGHCATNNYFTTGGHCDFLSSEANYSLNKAVCFMKNVMCGVCTSKQDINLSPEFCLDSSPLKNNKLKSLSKIKVYPNPLSSELKINGLNEDLINFKLMDMLGKELIHFTLNRSNSTIDVSHLIKGIYFIQWQKGKTIYSEKIIIH